MSDTRGLRAHQVVGYEYVPPNLLINGGFEIWQRGAGPFIFGTGSNGFTADEWRSSAAGVSGNCQWDRDTGAKIGTYCLKITPGASRAASIQQGIESYESLEGLTLTFSVWVKSTVAAFASIMDYDGTWAGSISTASTGSGSWERVTVTRTVRTGLLYPGTSDPPHLFPLFVQVYTAALGTIVYVDGATLVVGNYPEGVPFVPLSPTDDVARCLRFYQAYASYQISGYVAPGIPVGTSDVIVPMYTTPTLTMISSIPGGAADGGGILLNNAQGVSPATLQSYATSSSASGYGYIDFVFTLSIP